MKERKTAYIPNFNGASHVWKILCGTIVLIAVKPLITPAVTNPALIIDCAPIKYKGAAANPISKACAMDAPCFKPNPSLYGRDLYHNFML